MVPDKHRHLHRNQTITSSFGGVQADRWKLCCIFRAFTSWFGVFCQIYWTDFHNLFTIWKRFTCRWWICTLFSNLSSDVAMATK